LEIMKCKYYLEISRESTGTLSPFLKCILWEIEFPIEMKRTFVKEFCLNCKHFEKAK